MLIPYGDHGFTLPFEENKVNILFPNETVLKRYEVDEQNKVIEEALKNPVLDYNIYQWLKGKNRIVILIPDITRKCSVDIYLSILLRYIRKIGFDKNNIKIIIATGNHRPCNESEIRRIVGDFVYRNYRIFNHDSTNNLIYIGMSKYGNRIYINKEVYEADGILATGNITYHNFAGYSGGRKIILPGVSGKETIVYNHKLMVGNVGMCEKAQIGILENNPVHEDMLDAVRLVDKNGEKIYALNVVTNMYGEIIAAFSGYIEDVFRKGVEYVDQNYRIDVKQEGDVVICSPGGYPYDINFYQSFKSIYSANKITKESGYIFLVSECKEGLGEEYKKFKYWFSMSSNEVVNNLRENFDVVGQIAYWTKSIIENKHLVVITHENNIQTFKALGLEAINETNGKRLLFDLINNHNKILTYDVPYANIVYLNKTN